MNKNPSLKTKSIEEIDMTKYQENNNEKNPY